jgi:polyphosphate kinase
MTEAIVETPAQAVERRYASPGSRYVARQLSDLSFNDRLLDLAFDASVPLLERVKFLALFSERIDEFFQVQVGVLKQQIEAGVHSRSIDGKTRAELLEALREALSSMREREAEVFHDELVPALKTEGIELVGWDEVDEAERAHLDTLFDQLILPVLTPLTVDPSHPFPYLSNLSLNVGVEVTGPAGERRFARVKVPPNVSRLLQLPDSTRFIALEDVIIARLDELFPGVHIGDPFIFRVTRDADLTLEDEDPDDILKALQEELRRRRFLPVVRLEIDSRTGRKIPNELIRGLDLDPADIEYSKGPLGLDCLWTLHGINRPDLLDTPWTPLTPAALLGEDGDEEPSIFRVLDRRDVLVHHPYDSFAASVEALVRQAADDPRVLAIKQCLYRTSGDSPVVAALIRAAELGKQVAVLVEVTARFDEEANIGWARALEEAGAHVVYGLMGLKTHSKTTLVVREEGDHVRRYCHVGTGNYNPKTARMYEDLGLLSSRAELGADLTRFFNYITGFSTQPHYAELVTSPGGIREAVLEEIAVETEAGSSGRVIMKINGLDDPAIIDALYVASQAGVQVDLIIRGICCLRPGLPGLSENIRVRSIVGRFLEHSRILRFGGVDDRPPRFFIGSADMRRRNLERRVEAMVPVADPEACAILEEVLEINLADDTQTWELEGDGRWHRNVPAPGGGIATQEVLQHLALERAQHPEHTP